MATKDKLGSGEATIYDPGDYDGALNQLSRIIKSNKVELKFTPDDSNQVGGLELAALNGRVDIGMYLAGHFATQAELALIELANGHVTGSLGLVGNVLATGLASIYMQAAAIDGGPGDGNSIISDRDIYVTTLDAFRLLQGLKIGPTASNPAKISSSYRATVNFDAPAIAAGGQTEIVIALPGAVLGADVALALPAALPAGLAACAFVSAADAVKIRLSNITAVPIDPPLLTYGVRVFNP